MVKCLISVADHTGHMSVAVWNEQTEKVKEGKSYKFTNVGIKMFDEISLTTHPASIIT